MNLFILLIMFLLEGFALSWVILQVLWFTQFFDWSVITTAEDILKLKPTFDFGLLFNNEIGSVFLIVTIMVCAVMFLLTLLGLFSTPKGKARRRFFKTGYERKSYGKLLSTRNRIRGTQRIQYDRKGKITRKTLEVLMETVFYPIAWVQNKWCELRHLPERKRWNTRRTYEVGGVKQHHTSGIPVIAYRRFYLFGDYNKVYYLYGNIHNMFVGMTGRGKSMTFVLQMLMSQAHAGENMVVHDTKHELLAHMKPTLEALGYNVLVLNFDNPKNGEGWNPLTYPYTEWKKAIDETENKDYREANLSRAVEMILDIAQTVAYEEDARQPFWWQGAAQMIAGAAQLLMEEGKEEYVNFKSIRYLYQLGDDNNDGSKTTIAKFLKKYRDVDSGSGEKMKTYLEARDITKASLKAVFTSKINLLTATQDITEMTSHSTFDMKKVFSEKTAVFLLTQDEKPTYYPLVTMFFKQLYEVGIKFTKENPKGRFLDIPMNWVIDEMAILPEIKDIENIYAAARSRGLRIHGFIQSISQLQDKYEKLITDTILDNNTNIVYLGSGTKEVLKYFSEKGGKEVVYDKDKAEYISRDIVTPERLGLMERGRTLFTTVEWNPYISKLPPFNEFAYGKVKPNWSLEPVEKPEVRYFNIIEELKNRKDKIFNDEGIQKISFETLEKEINEQQMEQVVSD